MMRQVNVAVVGATGAVGEAMVEILEERNFPVKELHLLASERSEGKAIRFSGRSIRVKRLDQFDFTGVDIGLFSAGASISADFAPKAADAGCVVIDNTSQFRYDDDVPLVVPEVNPHAIARASPARHHRESELFDHPDGGCVEADTRRGRHRADQCCHVSIGIGRRREGHSRTRGPNGGSAEREADRAEGVFAADRVQRHSRTSTCSRRTATRRKK